MKREQPKSKKNLTKEDFKRFHRTGKVDVDPSRYDAFSQAALGGVRYQKEDPELVFSRMEKQLGLQDPGGARSVSLRLVMTAAATIAILISVGYLAFFQGASVSGAEMYNTHFMPLSYVDDDIKRGTRTQSNASSDIKTQAIQAYTEEDYAKAEGLFQLHLSQTDPQDRTARFFYGITLLDQGKLKPAISIFEDTRNNPPVAAFKRPATFYLALAHIRQEQHEKALPLLQFLANREDRYGRKASEILSDYGLKPGS
jgi:TolA-binding protein